MEDGEFRFFLGGLCGWLSCEQGVLGSWGSMKGKNFSGDIQSMSLIEIEIRAWK